MSNRVSSIISITLHSRSNLKHYYYDFQDFELEFCGFSWQSSLDVLMVKAFFSRILAFLLSFFLSFFLLLLPSKAVYCDLERGNGERLDQTYCKAFKKSSQSLESPPPCTLSVICLSSTLSTSNVNPEVTPKIAAWRAEGLRYTLDQVR